MYNYSIKTISRFPSANVIIYIYIRDLNMQWKTKKPFDDDAKISIYHEVNISTEVSFYVHRGNAVAAIIEHV